MRSLCALTLAFHISSCSPGSGLKSCDARLEISLSSSASTVSTWLPSLDQTQMFAVAGKKERASRGCLHRLIGTGHSHTQEIFTLAETARATNRHVAGVQGLQRSCEARSGEGGYFAGPRLRGRVRAIQARAVKDPRDKLAVSKLEDQALEAHAAPPRSAKSHSRRARSHGRQRSSGAGLKTSAMWS